MGCLNVQHPSLSLFHRLLSLLHMDRCNLIIWLPHGSAGAKNQLVLQKLQEAALCRVIFDTKGLGWMCTVVILLLNSTTQ